METEVKKALYTVVDYFAVQLNPAQMDKFGEVLTGMIQNTLDCMSMVKTRNDENLLDDLVEYAIELVELSRLLEKLNGYKIASCGKTLNITVED